MINIGNESIFTKVATYLWACNFTIKLHIDFSQEFWLVARNMNFKPLMHVGNKRSYIHEQNCRFTKF